MVLFVAFIFLLLSAVQWLGAAGIREGWGYLIIGLLVLIVGAILLNTGIQRIKKTSIVPNRALRQAQEDFATVREHLP